MSTKEFSADEWQMWLDNEVTRDYMDKLKKMQDEEQRGLSLCSSYEDYLRKDGRYLAISDIVEGLIALGKEVKE
jgi:uncharacterized protein YeeX (DUF496 family)